jgi:hypothetical protein
MKSLEDSNVSSSLTTISDEKGVLILEVSRKYGPAVSTAEAVAIEQALLDVVKAFMAAKG